MKRLIIGIIIGMSIMAVGLEAYDWQKDIQLQEQKRHNRESERQNQEILRELKKPC